MTSSNSTGLEKERSVFDDKKYNSKHIDNEQYNELSLDDDLDEIEDSYEEGKDDQHMETFEIEDDKDR